MHQSGVCLYVSGSSGSVFTGLHDIKYPLQDLGWWRTPGFCLAPVTLPSVLMSVGPTLPGPPPSHGCTLTVAPWFIFWLPDQVVLNQVHFAGTYSPKGIVYTWTNLNLWKQKQQQQVQEVKGPLTSCPCPQSPAWSPMKIPVSIPCQ